MSMLDTNTYYQDLYDLIQSYTGIHLTDHQRLDVERAVPDLLSDTGLSSIQKLLLKLSSEALVHPLWQRLVALVTIGETYFFRNQHQFSALRNDILPSLIARRRSAGTLYLRCWSAGCAAGEEPYSLAILLRELLPDLDQWSISILGTDINLASLERARIGSYRPWSFRSETPDSLSTQWFESGADGYELSGAIRRMVTFAPLNLVWNTYPSFETGTMGLDLILCRNVTIYFDEATTREIVSRFHQALNDDGWLVVGHSEPMAAIYHDFFAPHNFEGTVLYQKKPAEAQTATVLEPPPEKELLPSPSPKVDLAPVAAPPPQADAAQPDLLQQARQAVDQEAWSDALKLLVLAEAENRLRPELHYLRAMVLLHTDAVEKAIVSLRQAVYCDPDFALAHYTLAELYQDRKELKETTRHLRLAQAAVARLPPDCPLPHTEDLTAGMLKELIDHQFLVHRELSHVQ